MFSEGERCNGLHIIARGKVRIFKTSREGREQVLAMNGPGESIAELPVFDGGTYPASAVALGDVEILFISQALLTSTGMANDRLDISSVGATSMLTASSIRRSR